MSDFPNKTSESTTIELVESDIKSVKIRMTTKKGLGFILKVSNRGLEFYGEESSSGALSGIPIRKGPEQVFDWIKAETPEGGKKAFGEKVPLKKIGRHRK